MGWNVNMGRTPFIIWILFDNRKNLGGEPTLKIYNIIGRQGQKEMIGREA
ncbi:hypothetical protein HanIR_Chr04g0172611 [Helianthus annuus]|nr:hypothetical protein HanIR_Chr04g0172611 [Helianthus annuus]